MQTTLSGLPHQASGRVAFAAATALAVLCAGAAALPEFPLDPLHAVTPIALGPAAGSSGPSCEVARLDGSRFVAIWLDPEGRIFQASGSLGGDWSSVGLHPVSTLGVNFSQLSLAGNRDSGWWLAARTRQGRWKIWHAPDWEGPWESRPDPESVLTQPWLHCPGVLSVQGEPALPVLIHTDPNTESIVWLVQRPDGQWHRLETTPGGTVPPGRDFRIGQDADGFPVTLDPTTGEAMQWSFNVSTATAHPSPHRFPPGTIAWRAEGDAITVLRTGARIPGTAPAFPSAGLVLTRVKSSDWSDFAFLDDAPDEAPDAAALAIADGTAFTVHVQQFHDGSGECRLARIALGAKAAQESVWRRLPPYPNEPGIAGALAGAHGDALIIAGGANFPDRPPWENGKKRFYDEIFILPSGADAWQQAGRLPEPRAYAASVILPDGILCAGGENSTHVLRDTFLMRVSQGRAEVVPAPSLPAPVTSATAVLLGGSVYLAGGYGGGAPRVSRKDFWRLDLSNLSAGWHALPTWPGPSRGQAVMGVLDGAIYLLSGMEVRAQADGPTTSTYLQDGYRYRPESGWERLPDLPWSALAAPSPAPVTSDPPRIFVLGGVDGRQAGRLPRDTRLPRDILFLDVQRNQWRLWNEGWPDPVVTAPTIQSHGAWIFPSGETMAGKRTTHIWSWRIGSP